MDKNGKIIVGTIIGVLVFLFAMSQFNVFQANGLDEAMQQYLTAIQDGDTGAFVDLLPNDHGFRFSCYNGKTGNLMAAESYSRNQVIQNLTERGGLYFSLFTGDADYKYRDRIASAPLSSWHRIMSVYRWQEGNLKSYVKWQSEGGQWKVVEVGDMVP